MSHTRACAYVILFVCVTRAIDITDLINIGKIAWYVCPLLQTVLLLLSHRNVVKDGHQVVNYQEDYATAIPRQAAWDDLSLFQDFKMGPYGWRFADCLGKETVEFKWYYTMQCNGSYAGHGRFLTNIGATVVSIYSAWGYYVSVNCTVPAKPLNYGTPQEPIAGMQVFVTMEVATAVQTFVKKCLATVRGDCQIKIITCDGY